MGHSDRPVAQAADIKYRLLRDISQQISRSIDLQDVLNRLLEAVRSVVDYDAAGIFVLNRNSAARSGVPANMIAGAATVGFPPMDEATNDPMLRSGKGIIGHVIRTGQPVIAADVSADPHYIAGREGTRSEVAVPIVSNAEVIGALNLESNRLDAFSPADVELLEAFAIAAAISIEKSMLHRQVVEKHRIDQQLKIAHEVQVSLLPAEAPTVAGYDIAGLNLPAWDIGGDYFDYFPLPDGRLGLVVADVSGKGVPAALLMATFRAALRSEARKERPIREVVDDVHATLVECMDTSRFVTAVYGILDPRLGAFSYVNCGHNPPMLLRAGGGREQLATGRAALGMFGSEGVDPHIAHLSPGDVLLLYTDGVVEVNDANFVEFGEERLASVLIESASHSARDIIERLVSATRAHAGRDQYEDDFTLVVVKREPLA